MASAPRPARSRSGGPARTSGTGAPFDPFSALAAFLFRVRTLGLVVALAGLALVIAPYSRAAPVERLAAAPARALGLLLFVASALLVALGVAIYLQRIRMPRAWLRRLVGGTLLVIVLWGILGWPAPHWHLGRADLHTATLGGHIGRFLGRSILGALLCLVCAAGAALLLAPAATRRVLRAIPPALRVGGRTVWSWRIPQRLWRIVRDGFQALLAPGDDAPKAGKPAMVWVADDSTGAAPAEPEPADAHPVRPARVRASTTEKTVPVVPIPEPQPPVPVEGGPWPRPPRDLLVSAPIQEVSVSDNAARARLIEETLASFNVDAKVVQVSQGPTVTQFGVEPGWEIKTRSVVEKDANGRPILDKDGRPKQRTEEVSRTRVRVNEITRLANDLALGLAAPSIRIEAPVPGKPVVGIEVPSTNAAVVTLRQVIETPSFQRLGAKSKLALALGVGVSGEVIVADLAKMPHLLIAGATGAGKSVCINSIIACILMHATPAEVRFVMVDPKRVELVGYEPVPHLALSHVIVEMDEVVGTLGAVIHEMDSRYKKFASIGVRNLEAYNKHPRAEEILPQWVVIIDELADLMMAAPFEVEKQICRLAQLARATGIHLVIATQRPSVDVITGLIKANFPTRIAFAVTSMVDSRTILDTGGAEKLLGRGDMLFLAPDAGKPRRVQGVYVSDQEIEGLVHFWANEKLANLRPPKYDHLLEEAKAESAAESDDEEDPLLERARELAEEHSRISTSMLQRRLRIGYPRAARLMDLLESEGLVGGAEGLGSRSVTGSGGQDLF